MTVLAPYSERLQLGIDRPDRALLTSALLFKKALIGTPAVPARPGVPARPAIAGNATYAKLNTVRPVFKENEVASGRSVNVSAEIKLRVPYTASIAYNQSGSYIAAARSLTTSNPFAGFARINGYSPPEILMDSPITVTTLEQYIVWLSELYNFSAVQQGIKGVIEVKYLDENIPDPVVAIDAMLPLNLAHYLSTNSMLRALTDAVPALSVPVLPDEPTDYNFVVLT